MKPTTIAAIDVQPLDLSLTEPFAVATGAQAIAHNVLVRVRLEDGTAGLGEAAPFTAVSGETQAGSIAVLATLYEAALGRDAEDWETLGLDWARAFPSAPAARCGLEMAVVDALTRHRGQPLWRFFGGAGARLVTDMTITAGDAEHAAESARAIVARGIHTLKVKIGAHDAAGDLERLLAVREAAPHAILTVDANAGYDLEEARRFLAGLAQHDLAIALLEQPFHRDDLDAWRALARETPVPLCADESAKIVTDVDRIADEGLAAYVNIKTMKSGVAEAWRMVQRAKARGLGLMIGGMVESTLAMSFSAHLAAGAGGFEFVDLDTPMFIREHPFAGGMAQHGESLSVEHVTSGHGVVLQPK